MRSTILPIIALSSLLAAGTAGANMTFTFTASGYATSDGHPENATAVFDFSDSGGLAISLTNTSAQVPALSSVLSGVTFNISPYPGTASLTGGSAAGTIDCYANMPTCSISNGPFGGTFGWMLGQSASSFALLAGGGSLKPNGIANANTTGYESSNSQHNMYLLGPVEFDIGFAQFAAAMGGDPNVFNVVFIFGTDHRDTQTGVCVAGCSAVTTAPEPQTLALFGLALVALMLTRRRIAWPASESPRP